MGSNEFFELNGIYLTFVLDTPLASDKSIWTMLTILLPVVDDSTLCHALTLLNVLLRLLELV